jgi:predicted NAD/FAD-binding protein
MSKLKIEDLRLSSSSIDDFWTPKPAARLASGRIRISGMCDLNGFHFIAEDTLVHLAKQDFWKLGEDENGHFIERLVDDDGIVKG